MKDTEFFELLNLYLDHEISATDSARLETEVHANADRRRIYHDYCRMQKACTMLAKDFVEQPAEHKIATFSLSRSPWGTGLFAVGGLAVAAACVALVLVKRIPTAPDVVAPSQTLAAVAQPAVSSESTPVAFASATVPSASTTQIARTVTVPMRRAESRTGSTMPLMLTNTNANNAEALLAVAQQNAQGQFEWMKGVQLTPIQPLPTNELRFDARAPLQAPSRAYSTDQGLNSAVQMTAFRFQK